jgi:hypothetical protein
MLHSDFLLGLVFDPEETSDMFLRNVDLLSTNYMPLYYRRYRSLKIEFLGQHLVGKTENGCNILCPDLGSEYRY